MLRKKRAGKTTIETLGEWPYLSLQRAREMTRQRRNKDADPGARTLYQLCERFYDGVVRAVHKRPEGYKRYVDRDLTALRDRRAAAVRRADLADLLSKKRKDGPVAANRLLGVMKQLFAYGVEIGWLDESPADALTRRAAGGKEEPR